MQLLDFCGMNVELIVKVFSALLTPSIAMIASYIAYQQWKTNQQRVKLGLFDKRFRIYEEVKKMISFVISKSHEENSREDPFFSNFVQSTSDADFLFKPEIREYIDEVHKRGINLCRLQVKSEGENQEERIKKLSSAIEEEYNWFSSQHKVAEQKFKPYLSIDSFK